MIDPIGAEIVKAIKFNVLDLPNVFERFLSLLKDFKEKYTKASVVPDERAEPKAHKVSASINIKKLGIILYVNAALAIENADNDKAILRPKKSAIAPEGISRITIIAVK